MSSLNWNLVLRINGGPTLNSAGEIPIEAYDVIEVDIPNGKTDVKIQPGSATSIRCLMIKASKYEGISYIVTPESAAETDTDTDTPPDPGITLDNLHLFLGAGATTLLGNEPNILRFTNDNTESVNIEILVGRIAMSLATTSE